MQVFFIRKIFKTHSRLATGMYLAHLSMAYWYSSVLPWREMLWEKHAFILSFHSLIIALLWKVAVLLNSYIKLYNLLRSTTRTQLYTNAIFFIVFRFDIGTRTTFNFPDLNSFDFLQEACSFFQINQVLLPIYPFF